MDINKIKEELNVYKYTLSYYSNFEKFDCLLGGKMDTWFHHKLFLQFLVDTNGICFRNNFYVIRQLNKDINGYK